MENVRDEFLSEEDLDLRNLSEAELIAYWNLWLIQAQATNELDRDTYSHGVFETAPGPQPGDRAKIAGHLPAIVGRLCQTPIQ